MTGRSGSAEWVLRAYDRGDVMMATVACPDFTVVACNEAYRTFYAQPDVLGRTPLEVWPELDGQQLVEFLERVRQDGRPAAFEEWRFQIDRGAGEVEDVWLDFTLVPEVVDGEVIGIHFMIRDVGDRVRAGEEARHAIDEAREDYADALEAISRLQDQLLPDALPALPRVDVAASYLLAGAQQSAGGDWFDCVRRPDGTVALVVGDVVGHGVAASAVMGQLRAVLAAALLGSGPLDQALVELDRYARMHGGGAVGATVAVVCLDPDTGRAVVASAGHPQPILVPHHGEARFAGLAGSPPLATQGDEPRFHLGELVLAPEDVVVLVSDGLVERPGRTPTESTVEVLQVLTDVCQGRGPVHGRSRTVESATLDGLELLLRETGHDDDVTVLAAQWVSAPVPLRVRVDASHDGSRIARRALVGWLETLEVGVVDRVTIQHAAGELLDNVVAHAYQPGGRGELGLDARLGVDGSLRCRVLDDGRWRERSDRGPEERSPMRGLAMTRALVDHLDLVPGRGEAGTVAAFTQRLTRPARLLTRPVGGPAPAPGRALLEVELDPDVRVEQTAEGLVVSGDVDAGGAGTLRGLLIGAVGGGSLAAEVDLSGVTHLGSAGVQVLHELAGEGSGVTLRAPYGSVAQHVLSLAQLPFEG